MTTPSEEAQAAVAECHRLFDEAWDYLIEVATAEKTCLADAIVAGGKRRMAKAAAAAIAGLSAQPGAVAMPTNADEAALMCLLGERWLRDNAPGRLNAQSGAREGTRPEESRAQPFLHIEPAPGHRWIQATMEEWDEVQRIRDAATTPTEGPAQPERRFPMQRGPSIPWSLAEAIYAGYAAQYGTQQSLQRLGERGGFSWKEVEFIYADKRGKAAIDGAIESKVRASTLTDPEGVNSPITPPIERIPDA